MSMSMGTVHKFSDITYKVVRKKRKTISIKVTGEGEIIVSSPFNVSDETINFIVKKKEKWIIEKVRIFREDKDNHQNRSFENGEKFLYLGRNLELAICYHDYLQSIAKIEDHRIRVYINYHAPDRREVAKDSIINLYKEEARRLLKERTSLYSKVINVKPKRITIKSQKTIWGSCSTKCNINYNYRIIMAPIDIVDYIVVHELCHLIHMNHSKEYWDMVKSIIPDYEHKKQWLKVNGPKLKI